MITVDVKDLRKTYHRKRGILWGKKAKIPALKGVSFKLKRGEIVAYLGPNGSGKSTTIKILSGVLVPDGGSVDVLGYIPWERKVEFLERIGVLFGQKSGLIWDIPVRDGFQVLKEIYGVDENTFKEMLQLADEYLNISPFLGAPPRKLSLGQRVRCELAAVLLHDPEVLFLDEPTIGIDIWTRVKIRKFLKELSKGGKTVFVTTHQLEEVEAVAERVILIRNGTILFDGPLQRLLKLIPYKIVSIEFRQEAKQLDYPLVRREENLVVYKVPRKEIPQFLELAKDAYSIIDMSIQEPKLEDVLLGMEKLLKNFRQS